MISFAEKASRRMFNSTENATRIISPDFILQLTFLVMQVIVLILGACGIMVPRYRPPDFNL